MQHHCDLQHRHSFQLPASAQHLFEFSSIEALQTILNDSRYQALDKRVLGGGSNTVFMKDFDGLILHPKQTGIELIEQSSQHVVIECQAAVVWDDLVDHCVQQGWSGIENLSAIPGHVGAAPIQNIGAYGVEIASVFRYLNAIDLTTGQPQPFSHNQCCFSYRNSRFKGNQKFLISSVCLRLNLNFRPNLTYKDLAERFDQQPSPSLQQIRQSVIEIRQKKLPDPKLIPNAGSFFKNPIVSADIFEALQQQYPDMPCYPVAQEYKIPAAWLIQQCGLKAYRHAGVGVSENHALVLINHNQAKSNELAELIKHIQQQVDQRFGIPLHPEVELVG